MNPQEHKIESKEVKRLIDIGKEKGFLTFDEVNDALPQDIVTADQLDTVLTMFDDLDIELVENAEEGKLLKGASLTPPELLNQYPVEEQQFVKGLVVATAESEETPEAYYKNLVAGAETGQTEAKNLTINDYPAYLVKGNIRGISYTIYIVSHNNRIVYFNYRSMEETSAHQNDIKKAIDFGPYLTDLEAIVNSIKFLK